MSISACTNLNSISESWWCQFYNFRRQLSFYTVHVSVGVVPIETDHHQSLKAGILSQVGSSFF